MDREPSNSLPEPEDCYCQKCEVRMKALFSRQSLSYQTLNHGTYGSQTFCGQAWSSRESMAIVPSTGSGAFSSMASLGAATGEPQREAVVPHSTAVPPTLTLSSTLPLSPQSRAFTPLSLSGWRPRPPEGQGLDHECGLLPWQAGRQGPGCSAFQAPAASPRGPASGQGSVSAFCLPSAQGTGTLPKPMSAAVPTSPQGAIPGDHMAGPRRQPVLVLPEADDILPEDEWAVPIHSADVTPGTQPRSSSREVELHTLERLLKLAEQKRDVAARHCENFVERLEAVVKQGEGSPASSWQSSRTRPGTSRGQSPSGKLMERRKHLSRQRRDPHSYGGVSEFSDRAMQDKLRAEWASYYVPKANKGHGGS